MKKEIISFLLLLNVAFACAQSIANRISAAEENLRKNHWERAFEDFSVLVKGEADNLTYQQRAIIYNHLGFLNLMFLEPEEAERNLNLSILYHEEAGVPDEKNFADALVNMGMLYLEQVEFDLARRYTQRALNILEKRSEYTVEFLIARTKLARIYEEAGSYTLALSIYNDSYDKLVAMGNELSPDFADICSHKGRILILTGDPLEGEKFIGLSSTIYESLGPQYNVQRAESMEDLALFYERMGRYDEAEEMLLEILELKRSIPDEADILIIETLNDLGIMYHQLGRYSQAEAMFNEVVVECEENVGTDHPFYATAKNNLGTIALNKGDFVTARDMLTDALITYREKFGTVHPYYANTLNNLARVERKLENISTAEKYYKEVLKIDQRIFGENHPNYATTLLNIGILYSGSGREVEAEEYYAQALSIRESALGVNHPSFGSALKYMGMHYLATNKLREAEKNFRRSINIQINQIKALFPIMTERERERFFLSVKEEVDRYNYIASQLLEERPALVKNIFDFQIRTKTLMFNSLDKIAEIVRGSNDDLLQARYQKWLSDKRLLASYYQMGVEELSELHVNLNLVEVDIDRQEANLKLSLEAFEEVLPQMKLGWEKVLGSVKPNESIIEIVRIKEFESLTSGEDKLYGFTDNTQYLAIIFNYGETEPKHAFLGEKLTSDEQHYQICFDALERGIDQKEVFRIYWNPILEAADRSSTVRVVPDGIYYKINPNRFKADNNKYVIDKQYVSYLTSVHDAFRSNQIIINNKTFLFGNPDFNGINDGMLEFELQTNTRDEISQLNKVLQGSTVSSFLNEDASEFRLRSAYNPTVLHIASPGFFESKGEFISYKNPLDGMLFNSGLYLTGAGDSYEKYLKGIPSIPENDGILTTYEMMNLDLDRTRLVVLSTLAPMPNKAEGGEGFYGLLRALTVAGARNVIASLKQVDIDSRNELLELFYKKFLETDKIEESFKYAQLELRKKYNDPTIWGSFILTGYGS